MASTPTNTATTLSVAFRPGEDLRFANTSSQSIFTFGDYRIERSNEVDTITGSSMNLNFTPFSTLENMGVDDFNPKVYTSIQNNELRPIKTDPYSYTYFGSFYTEVARSINNILDTFPYAALAVDTEGGNTVYDYSESFNTITGEKLSSFKIPADIIINQGYILFNSGSSVGNQVSLMTQTNLFEVQLSGTTTAQTESYVIKTYSYVPGASAYLQFEIYGHLSAGSPVVFSGTASTAPVYIRPSRKRTTEYRMQQSRLEMQLLRDGLFDIPDVDDEKRNFRYRLQWPRTIDGFNPDTTGTNFENYKNNILLLAGNVDMDKTDIMIKTIIPDNYLDFDTNTQIYRKLVSSYAKQFDEIKQFIDNIAFAHSLNYNDEESVPEKFLVKLSNLLGWKLSSTFSDINLFEYLADDENPEQNSFAYYNVEIWKRILININWLYKRKGTRDALQFIFKLMGAPECLVVFDEFIYEIQSTITTGLADDVVSKSNSRGYINYDASQYIFQEGGLGRGDGQRYIKQWEPEFEPFKVIDNIKVQVGLTAVTGSEDIVNTKELCATLSPANAVECDVFHWYQESGTTWVWGTTVSPYFSGNTVPFEYQIDEVEFVAPEFITGMTFNDYMEFIYASNINPKNRKTNSQVHTTFGYPELKKIYMNYYLMTYPQSNMLTIKKLEAFLELMEVNFQDYLLQLIPATTILECQGTTYRNTIFHRQRFVYKEGINDGSEFQSSLPPNFRPNLVPTQLSTKINDFYSSTIIPVVINSGVSQGINKRLTAVQIQARINENNISVGIEAVDIFGEIQPGTSSTTIVPTR
ncbi:MAG: hypothetical protein AABY15_04200 [Nanoarchaeota archaeon]